MKKSFLSILAVALLVTGLQAQTLDRSVRPKAGPAPTISLGKTESFTLSNGLKVFVVENHKIPAVTYSIQLDIKPELQGDMTGYQDFVGELITSGTKTRTKDQLNEQIDFIGANINASAAGMSGNCLKKHQQQMLDLMSDMLLHPDFKQEELDKQKTQTISGLQTELNEPDAMLRNVTAVIDYGPNHPNGEVSTEQTVKNITLKRCQDYFSTYFRPNVAYLAVVGDVTVDEVRPLIEKAFGSWEKKDVPRATYPAPQGTNATHVAFAARDAAVQSVFNIAYPVDLKPGQPDVIRARVANAILGDGSQGRLFLNLREGHGWTYGSYSSIRPDEDGGEFTAYAKCRNVVTDSAITQALAEMNRMRNETVDETSLKNTITYLTGNFAIGLESPQTVAQYAINIERYHMPADYYTNYLKNLSAVTAADVQAIAKKYITPANANIIVVGNKDEAKKMEVFGKVDYYDNYGKPVVMQTAAVAPSNMTADQVRKNYIAAIGGEAVINGIKDIKEVRTMEMQGMTLTLTEMKKGGDKMKQVVEAMGQTFQKMVVNGKSGFQEAQGQKQDLAGEELKDAKKQADIQAVLHSTDETRTLRGTENVNGADMYVLDVTDKDGSKSVEYYDMKTGFLMKEVSSVKGPDGSDAPQITEFSDYQEVPGSGGYKVAYGVKQSAGGAVYDTHLSTIDINKGIDDTEFK